jgi:hypothetical protein
MRLMRLTARRRLGAASVVVLATLLMGPAPPGERYFPDGVFDSEDKEENDFLDTLYSAHLRAMGEPSLWALSRKDHAATVYRLLWVPSFHHRIAVRVVKSGGSYTAHAVELDGKGGLEPGKVLVKKAVKLTGDQWTRLLVYLERSRYWKMPTGVKMTLETGLTLDGDNLVCEGVEGGKYHVVDRVDADPNYEKLCLYMLRLSGLGVKEAWEEYHDDGADDKGGK